MAFLLRYLSPIRVGHVVLTYSAGRSFSAQLTRELSGLPYLEITSSCSPPRQVPQARITLQQSRL
jgi:hypothetical protein